MGPHKIAEERNAQAREGATQQEPHGLAESAIIPMSLDELDFVAGGVARADVIQNDGHIAGLANDRVYRNR